MAKIPDFRVYVLSNQVLTLQQIKEMYPNEWVLVGNPDLGDPKKLGSIVKKLISGIVLDHSKDKREVAEKAKGLPLYMERFTCIYTGEFPGHSRTWLRFVLRHKSAHS